MPDRLGELIDRIDQLLRNLAERPVRADHIIRGADLATFVGLKRTQVQVLIQNGEFPAPVPLSDNGRSKGFLESEIRRWQIERIAKRDAQR
jgi:predicted DNA-binding transcriptional regulator AlpA